MAFTQEPQIRLSKDFGEYKINKEATFWRDDFQTSQIEDILKKGVEPFELVTNANIVTGRVKHRGWVRVDLLSDCPQDIILEIQNTVLDSLKIYQVSNNQIVRRIENFNKTTPLENRSIRARTFAERLHLIQNQPSTIYISHDVGYALATLPIKIWQESVFTKSQESQKQYQGIFYGILLLTATACLLVGIFLKIKLFAIFGLNVVAQIFYFLLIDGFLHQSLPENSISNKVYSLELLLLYCPFLIHILFVRGITRIDEHKFGFIRRLYRVVVGFSVVYFAFTIFLPIWIRTLPHNVLESINTIAVFAFPMILVYFFFALYSSLQRTQFVKFYLLASVVGLLVTLIVFLNNGFYPIHYEINNNLLRTGFLIVILIIFVGLLFQIREYFTTVQQNQFMPDVSVEIRRQDKILLKKEKDSENTRTIPLTKRELEILKAFANGFTHQEIAEAMFISPHTAKTHLKTIYRKLNINSKVEAVRWILDNEE